MFIRVRKIIFLEKLLENKKIISAELIERIFSHISQQENFNFDFDETHSKRKIQSILVCIKKAWNKIERNGQHARKKFMDECRNQKVELDIELSNFDNELMDVDPINVDILFNNLKIK